jgi:hypothetical protein
MVEFGSIKIYALGEKLTNALPKASVKSRVTRASFFAEKI